MDRANVTMLPRDATAVLATPKTLRVKAAYSLSESGRKASLLTGGNGRAEQFMEIEVPTNRLHLVTVDAEGNAHLKLRPRYATRPDGRITRSDSPAAFDVPPSVDDLLLTAAKNYELERAFINRRRPAESRREEQRQLRARLAEDFLKSPQLRAAAHPPPSKKRCYLTADTSRVLFDADRDDPPAREVPAEAYRRFRSDERATRERNLAEHARRLALHEEKLRFVAEWITAKGSPNQRERHAAGLLPMTEAIEAIADEAFMPLGSWPRYAREGAAVLQAHLCRHPQYKGVVISAQELGITDTNASEATPEQWRAIQQARVLLPGATVTLRAHRLTWKSDVQAPALTLHGLLIVLSCGPLVVRREFSIPDAA